MVDTTSTGKTQPASSGRTVVSRESLQLATRRPAGRQPVVLLAEDDARVRESVRMLIEMQGCTVIEATDGWQAAAFASAYAGPIDLLVSDAVMPGMTGPAVYDLVRRQRPELPALFISGHPKDAVFPNGVLPPRADFLHKPFTPQQFAEAFEQLVPDVALGPRRVA